MHGFTCVRVFKTETRPAVFKTETRPAVASSDPAAVCAKNKSAKWLLSAAASNPSPSALAQRARAQPPSAACASAPRHSSARPSRLGSHPPRSAGCARPWCNRPLRRSRHGQGLAVAAPQLARTADTPVEADSDCGLGLRPQSALIIWLWSNGPRHSRRVELKLPESSPHSILCAGP